MLRRSLPLVLLALPLWMGCGKKETPEPVDQFPNALIGLEKKTEKVFAAFDAGYPKAADGPIHDILRDFNAVERLAGPAGLNADQQAALKQATESLLDAYDELHVPMHNKVFPEDFDFEPIRERMTEGLAAIRAALPESFAAQMQTAQQARDAAKPKDTDAEDAKPVDNEAATTDDEAAADPPADNGAAVASPAFRVAAGPSGDHVAPLCPSVMLWDDASLELAPERVNRVAELMAGAPPGRRWVQFVPTLQARLNADLTIDAYGTMRDRDGSWTAADNFAPATDALADRFRDTLAAAIGQAVRRGLHISILPHLDPAGGPTTEWRNLYDFAPGDTIGAGSYESLLIEPLAAAIEAEATRDTQIDLALSGEMGRSLFEHPAEYLALLKRLRQRFASNPNTAGVRIGVALNWSGVAGGTKPSRIDREATAELFAACDFLGFSCYAPVSLPPTADDFLTATRNHLAEVESLLGVAPPTGRLIYSETGIGGGEATLQEIAAKPYEGQGSPRTDPWKTAKRRALRLAYHEALCDYLANSQIEKAFLWSEGPWDPQGITDKRFRDESISTLIDGHNQRER